MADLFTINKSPFETSGLTTALRFAPAESGILLLEDGVYAAMRGTHWESVIGQHQNKSFYVLQEDLAARGLNPDKLMTTVRPVDYAGFVDLVVAYDKVQAW
ncbi:MAG: sulfurtransferase complex subunit TusB [Pseudomonadota bacterium]